MSDVTPQTPTFEGAEVQFRVASQGGDALPMRERVVLLLKNEANTARDVTLLTQATPGAGEEAADEVVSISANSVGAFWLNRSDSRGLMDKNGKIQIRYQEFSEMKVAALRAR